MQFRQPRDSCSVVSRGVLHLRSILVASAPPISFPPPPPLSTLFASSDHRPDSPCAPHRSSSPGCRSHLLCRGRGF
ncbi:hypothetical protein ACMD2_00319 [Ananas comosus]|uniref:Uncharacterized protein n=1 Tax=Ananas comosus TaxID=4615 RepID=A0A199W2Q5_ANACO|nr:hypothetical protein ACMD2_00319 [Ananas comosus]